jgi:hypothetical protein
LREVGALSLETLRPKYGEDSHEEAAGDLERRPGSCDDAHELTVIDPETWTAPWTVALDLKPQASGMYEYACHEGNYAMRNMLSAARADEAAAGQPGGR